MEIVLTTFILILVCMNIRQWIQIRKLRLQTIEAFKKMCEKVFEDNINDIR